MARLLWTQKQHVGPRPRVNHAMVFDSQRRRVVLFGGDSVQSQLFGDTWEWDGENWTQVDDIGPSPRAEHGLAYDAARRRVVLFGGTDGNNALGDTWEWDGEEWVQVEDTGPASRRDHAMTFDDRRDRVVLFGGTSTSQSFGDTWEWDGTAWTQASAFGPPAGLAATLIWTDPRSLMFGGISALSGTLLVFGNTWEWDGRHWTIRQDMGPGPRWNHAMVFDSVRRRGVLFGGTASTPGGAALAIPLGDTWEQFERGTPPPAGESTLQSVNVNPPEPQEGENFTIDFTLTNPAQQNLSINFSISDAVGTQLVSENVAVGAGFDHATFEAPGAFSPGTYTVTAALGEATRTANFTVTVNTSLTLQSLGAAPNTVAPGGQFTLTVTLSGPAPGAGLIVPMQVTFPDGTTTPFGIQVQGGATSGDLTINAADLPGVQGTLTFTATFGGQTSTATVELTA